ncbi:hypothetical protein AUJ13_02010, partial [Candidatus Micrarchaeota archaeon CG1_02_49_24]
MPQSKSNPGEKEVKRSLDSSIADGASFSVMAGLGDTYVPPFAVALGATTAQVGLLTALPYAISGISQAIISHIPGITERRKEFVLLFAFIHGIAWIFIALLAIFLLPTEMAIIALIILFSVYSALNAVAIPPWSGWMADLVPEHQRGSYFGKRNAVAGFALLAATIAGGWLLGLLEAVLALQAFAVLFLFAFLWRMVSVFFLWRMADVSAETKIIPIHPWDFLSSPAWHCSRTFAIYVALMQFATNLAGPFFVVYMLRDLHMDYFTFAVLVGITSLVRIVSMPYWGRLADIVGSRNVLRVSGLLVPIAPVLWVFSAEPLYLVFAQVFSGFAWAGFDLSTFNYALSSASKEHRVSFISYYSLMNNLMIFAGALLGGLVAEYFASASLLWMHGLLLLFLLSGAIRLAVSFVFLPLIEERKLTRSVDEYFEGAQTFRNECSEIAHSRSTDARATGQFHEGSGRSNMLKRVLPLGSADEQNLSRDDHATSCGSRSLRHVCKRSG